MQIALTGPESSQFQCATHLHHPKTRRCIPTVVAYRIGSLFDWVAVAGACSTGLNTCSNYLSHIRARLSLWRLSSFPNQSPSRACQPSLGFCSLHSHCDIVFQQSDQPSETVSAGCHRQTVLRVFPCGCKFSHVGASFPTCTCLRQDEISSPQDIPASDPQLVPSQGFFELWVQVFQLAHAFDTMKSCRHKRHDELVSQMGYPTRAENIPQILLRRLFQRVVSANGKRAPQLQKPRLHSLCAVPPFFTVGSSLAHPPLPVPGNRKNVKDSPRIGTADLPASWLP